MVITAKRVDTDEVAKSAVTVAIPESELGQRRQLTDLVHERYPEAEFRSFANRAASFLDGKLLIVACYLQGADNGSEAGPSAEDDASQQQLFAA